MGETTSSLNELLQVLNDSVGFYDDAAEKVGDSIYQSLFRRMAANKRAIAEDLRAEIAARGDAPAGGSVRGSLRQGWTDLLARLSGEPELRFVSQLEESEDAVIRAFREAVLDSDRAEVRAIAQKHMAEINRMHEEIRNLKHRLQKAA